MSRLRRRLAGLTAAVAAALLVFLVYRDELREIPDRWHGPFLNPEAASRLTSPADIFTSDQFSQQEADKPHAIDSLIADAKNEANSLLARQSHNLSAAADAYRNRRGRHPPPNFDEWFRFAAEHDSVVVEDFFDQIYRDIEPFWGLDAAVIRSAAATLPHAVHIRDGKASKAADDMPFMQEYLDLFQNLEHLLPDLDIPINTMDESRIIVPWEEIDRLMTKGAASKQVETSPTLKSFDSFDQHSASETVHEWTHQGPYWDLAKAGCRPLSAGRRAVADSDYSTPPTFLERWPDGTYEGYVSNWTEAKDPCIHAHLRNMHGTFVEPISLSTATALLPIFSGSKLPMNNDILLPGAVYWHGDTRFSTSKRTPWRQKRNEVLWRGSASGGRNTDINWTRFQRHRLLSMLNGTQVDMTLKFHQNQSATLSNQEAATTARNNTPDNALPLNFPISASSLYPLSSFSQGLLPDWLRSLSNAAFTWLVCFPATRDYGCSYTGSWYRRGTNMPLYRMFKAKYLPDVDGNSFSGRYLAFLGSNSLPIKATIYNEWHDDRLVAWHHFVPMDNTFVDLWAILEYFIARDSKAQEIAEEGQRWTQMVLRKEDMLVYVYRLMLEFARVSSEQRDVMGWSG